jgi:hypothetical protein
VKEVVTVNSEQDQAGMIGLAHQPPDSRAYMGGGKGIQSTDVGLISGDQKNASVISGVNANDKLPSLLAKRFTLGGKIYSKHASRLSMHAQSDKSLQKGFSIQSLKARLNGLIAGAGSTNYSTAVGRTSGQLSKQSLIKGLSAMQTAANNPSEVSASVAFSRSIAIDPDRYERSSIIAERESKLGESHSRSQLSNQIGGQFIKKQETKLPRLAVNKSERDHRRSKTTQDPMSSHEYGSRLFAGTSAYMNQGEQGLEVCKIENSVSKFDPNFSSSTTRDRHEQSISKHTRSKSQVSVSVRGSNLQMRANSFLRDENGRFDPTVESFIKRKKEHSRNLRYSIGKSHSVQAEQKRLEFINNDLISELHTLLVKRRAAGSDLLLV